MAEAFDQLLLPEGRTNWRTLGVSVLGQILLVLLLISAGLISPNRIVTGAQHLIYTPLVTKSAHPEHFELKVKTHPVSAPPLSARLLVPREVRADTHKSWPEAPKIAFAAPKLAPALVRPAAAMPAIVHTGGFSDSPVSPTVMRATETIQTGGFGDPNGTLPRGKGEAKLMAARMGSFDAAQGPGSGNGHSGTRGLPGKVASTDFGNGLGTATVANRPASGRSVIQAGGFGDASAATARSQQRTAISAPSTTPVEILSKPKPVYTEEARTLGLQGEVLVRVLFAADGQAHVLGVVKGLGHGLDEAAVNAAGRIRFKPGQQSGRPVDSTAVVHVIFELAD